MRRRLPAAVMATVAVLAGLVVMASPASAAPSGTCPRVFILGDGQLYSGVPNGGPIVFAPVGAPVPGGYNAMGYNPFDGMLYAAQGRTVVRIDPDTGVITPVGPIDPPLEEGVIAGVIGPGGLYYVVTDDGTTLSEIDLDTGTRTIIPLSQQITVADITYSYGFFWSASRADGMVRIDPATGTVTTFPLPAGIEGGGRRAGFGGVFTYPNGDIGVVQNDPGIIYRVAITNPASANPTFTVIDFQASPDAEAHQLDAASCVPPPVPLNCDTVPSPDPGLYVVVRLTEGDDVYDGSGSVAPLFIIGGGGHDRITGSPNNDIILGGAGNDTLNGGGGDDAIWGDADNDIINGQAGNDLLCGREGNDAITGGDGNDRIFGEAGNDSMQGENGDDLIVGAAGNDFLDGGGGNNANIDDPSGYNYCLRPSPCRLPAALG